jgi:hypothetical protein
MRGIQGASVLEARGQLNATRHPTSVGRYRHRVTAFGNPTVQPLLAESRIRTAAPNRCVSAPEAAEAEMDSRLRRDEGA